MFANGRRAALLWGIAALGSTAADAADDLMADTIVVVAPTPLSGNRAGQIATASDLAASHALGLTDYLDRSLGSVFVNDVQGNPLQPDINYRGYTASPLLGTPQGLSVYVDGVRVNQPFGDIVSWDLIPRDAIAAISLVDGANPAFGRNSLGGALSIRTKDGRSDPGTTIELNHGSFDRTRIAGQTGGASANGLNWYLTANRFDEAGWRDASHSRADQAFGKLGWSDIATDIALSGGFADTDLNGNGLQEQRLLANEHASVYTRPDNTRNRAFAFTAIAKHAFSATVHLSANAHYRHIRTRTYNGDINGDALGENLYQPNAVERAALTTAGIGGFPTSGESQANTPFPRFRCIADALLNSEPEEKCNGLINRTDTHQHDAGIAAELSVTTPLPGLPNAFVAGMSWEDDRAHFVQSAQFGYITPDHRVVGVTGPGAFADGTQDSENAFDARVDLIGRTRSWGVYAADTVSPVETVKLTLSGRFDRTTIRNRDALNPGGGAGSLDAHDHYQRFNPAVRIVYTPGAALTIYGGYGQTSRAPSAVEIGCADPANPCRLPNAFAGDPPLQQVITRTIEAGVRGTLIAGAIRWNLGVFRADNHRDILFVASDQTGFGYFRNFGKTRRQGIEAGIEGGTKTIHVAAHYTFLDATYRSAERVNGAGNSSNDAAPGFSGDIAITPGNRIPLIPRHIFKASAAIDLLPMLTLSADVHAQSSVYARGNENNAHRPDGIYYLGAGKTSGYALLDLGAEWRPSRALTFFVQVNNVLDRKYANAAQLGATGFNADGSAFVARPFAGPVIGGERPLLWSTFYAPGAPRAIWCGVKLMFGRR
jgi:outer membrane receptor protein involved in Fe transport